MATQENEISIWLNAMGEATQEMAEQSLSLKAQISSSTASPQSGLDKLAGSFISLSHQTTSVQIGIVADHHGLQYLAKAILNISEKPNALPDPDVADAVGEIINIIAGGIKRRLSQPGNALALGLPIFVNGPAEQGQSLQAAATEVQIGDIKARLLVFKKKL